MKRIMERLIKAHIRLTNNQRGATMVEYAMLVAAVAIAVGVVIGNTGAAASLMGKINALVGGIDLTP